MPKSLKETVKALLLENENAATLKPGSKMSADAIDKTKRAEGEIVDLGPAIVTTDSAKKDLAKSTSKSKEPGPTPPVKAEKMKVLDKKNPEDEMTSRDDDQDSDHITEADDDSDEDKEDKKKNKKNDNGSALRFCDDDEDDVKESRSFKFEVDVKEDMNAMFNGSDLSEEFKSHASTIFEAALISNLQKYKDVLDKEYDETVAEAVAEIAEQMDTKVEKYLNYVSEQWLAENEVAIESSLRTELTEDFIAGLRNLFLENYIDIPEDKVSVVEDMSLKVEELEDKLNEEIKRNIELAAEINEAKKINIVATVTEGLTDTQAEKIASLAEAVDFTTEAEYTEKVTSLVESYYSAKPVKKDVTLIAEVSENPDAPIVQEEVNSTMSKYVNAIGKSLPK